MGVLKGAKDAAKGSEAATGNPQDKEKGKEKEKAGKEPKEGQKPNTKGSANETAKGSQHAQEKEKGKEKEREEKEPKGEHQKPKEKVKGKDEADGKEGKGGKRPRQDDNAAGLWREADALKRTWQSASANYLDLTHRIRDDPDWSWARSRFGPELEAAHKQVLASIGSWPRIFLMSDTSATLRRTTTVAKATVEIEAFLKARGAIEGLADLCARIARAHSSLYT